MFGGIVGISGALGTPHTWSVRCWRFGAPKSGFVMFYHARQARACSDTRRPSSTRFSKAVSTGLPLLYAREFGAQNIYLLVPMDGKECDISLESGRPPM